jgi:hypothetical protein
MFYVVCPSHRDHVRRCLEILGLYDELAAEGFAADIDVYTSSHDWQSAVTPGLYPLPADWAAHIAERMKAVFLTRTTKEWERIFGRGRFPGAPQRWLQEWLNDDHAESAGLIIELNDPEYGPMTQPGPMLWMRESGESMLEPAARRWVQTAEALKRLRREPHACLDAAVTAPWGGLTACRYLICATSSPDRIPPTFWLVLALRSPS